MVTEIFVINRVTGSGYDWGQIGHFSNQLGAIQALEAHLQKRGYVFSHQHVCDGINYDIEDVSYFLQYKIQSVQLDVIDD